MNRGFRLRPPSLGIVNLAVFAVFMFVAGVGTIVPHIVKDRLPEQFRPLWQRILGTPDEAWAMIGDGLAVASQWVIGITELAAGGLAAAATLATGPRRLVLAKIALGTGTALFGVFMVVLFFLHEASLPKWDQYPALLVWIAVTWFLLERETPGPGR